MDLIREKHIETRFDNDNKIINRVLKPFHGIKNGFKSISSFLSGGGLKLGIKGIKSFIDDNFREKVIPIEGSVLYADLFAAVEHSGIYIGNGEISNIINEGGKGIVKVSDPSRFVTEAKVHSKIYVSCDKDGSVGNIDVSNGAQKHIGDSDMYGLIYDNCHEFSEKCLNYSTEDYTFRKIFEMKDIDETWEYTIKQLKKKARKKIGATKWKLWDWDKQKEKKKQEEPDITAIEELLRKAPLNSETMKYILKELRNLEEYKEEISDENIPDDGMQMIGRIIGLMKEIETKYEEVKGFISLSSMSLTYDQLKEMDEDFSALLNEMKNNKKIKEVTAKLGREYIAEWKKKKKRIQKRERNEIFGIHRSNDLVRLLPSEFVNLENEELEYLFYSKYLEENLLTYELGGKSTKSIDIEEQDLKKGPVVACLDTSGSMSGEPMQKAKALLVSIASILEKEKRSLYIILFGSKGEIKETNIENKEDSGKLFEIINSGFGGGTDFETPINRGIEIIETKGTYNKADILMITDGLCSISDEFQKKLEVKKNLLDFSIYTIICNGNSTKDSFSDEIIGI